MTISRNSVWIVIAAFNEQATIASVVADVRRLFRNVLVVDDGSADATQATARVEGAATIRHPINLGQGAALQTGIEHALRRGATHIVTFDADGQHLADDIPKMLSALEEAGADIACGSRFIGQTVDLPQSRRLALKLATVFMRIVTGLPLTDAHNGLRAMTASCARTIRIRQNRMAHASEIISQVAQRGLKVVEVPITIVYTEYSLRKGQRLGGAVAILIDLLIRRLYR